MLKGTLLIVHSNRHVQSLNSIAPVRSIRLLLCARNERQYCLRRTSLMAEQTLEGIRDRIRSLDREVVGLAAERLELTRQAGEIKRRQNRPTVDYKQERV